MPGNNRGPIITSRERQLLRTIALLRVVDREQSKIIGGYGSTTRVNVGLLKLTRAGLLKRVFVAVGPGTKKSIYSTTAKGAALISAPYRRLRLRADDIAGAELFVDHRQNVNWIYIALHCQALPSLVRLLSWQEFSDPLSKAHHLIPDAYFELDSAEGQRSVFLEVDMGTETARTWRKKIEGYLDLATSGKFSQIFGKPRFRVLIVTTTAKRAENLRRVIARQTPKIFFLTTFEQVKTAGFWSHIWLRPTGGEKHAFM